MYEKPEAGEYYTLDHALYGRSAFLRPDLMLRKPRNARTDRLTDWRFFIQIYLVRTHYVFCLLVSHVRSVHWPNDVAMRNEHVVLVHVAAETALPRCHFGVRQVG